MTNFDWKHWVMGLLGVIGGAVATYVLHGGPPPS